MSERPSRFKYCLNIEGMQIKTDILNIIEPILGNVLNDAELNIIANDLKGNTLDYIKQYCFDKLMNITHYGKNKKSIGFTTK